MTVALVVALVVAIAGVMLAVLAVVLELLEFWRAGDPYDQGESRS